MRSNLRPKKKITQKINKRNHRSNLRGLEIYPNVGYNNKHMTEMTEEVQTVKQPGIKTIAVNRKARHDYFVQETYEAGIELFGTEVKSLRLGQVNLKDSWCDIQNAELFIKQMHISPYEKGNIFNRDPIRPRKLLMHKREILKLYGTLKQEGLTLIPLSLYFKNGRVKVELGLCKGKKLYDKRDDIAKRDAKRTIDRAMKNHL